MNTNDLSADAERSVTCHKNRATATAELMTPKVAVHTRASTARTSPAFAELGVDAASSAPVVETEVAVVLAPAAPEVLPETVTTPALLLALLLALAALVALVETDEAAAIDDEDETEAEAVAEVAGTLPEVTPLAKDGTALTLDASTSAPVPQGMASPSG